ncbi:hypothetical protein Bca4012_030800 [Brassica carinata]
MAEEHSSVMVTPAPAVGLKRSGPASTVSLRKRVHDYINKEIAAGEEEGAGFITPQKKLLNSIEMVEKIVTSEIKRMQSTPRAKREERETVVKHLVSLRPKPIALRRLIVARLCVAPSLYTFKGLIKHVLIITRNK